MLMLIMVLVLVLVLVLMLVLVLHDVDDYWKKFNSSPSLSL